MIVAQIALDEMQQRAPHVKARAERLLTALSNSKWEDQRPFVEAATFPDKWKHYGYQEYLLESEVTVQDHWHYTDIPYFNGIPKQDIKIDEVNVVNAISKLKVALANPADTDDVASYQLRCLIHYVGDVHQPLHATSMYSSDFPEGDRGGNSFTLDEHQGVENLHALWDSAVLSYPNDWQQPLSNEDLANVEKAATEIRNTFTRGRLFLTSKDPAHWAKESNDACTSFVYQGVQIDSWPNDQYIHIGQMLAKQRLAYAGYRLADLLMEIWGNNTPKEATKFLW